MNALQLLLYTEQIDLRGRWLRELINARHLCATFCNTILEVNGLNNLQFVQIYLQLDGELLLRRLQKDLAALKSLKLSLNCPFPFADFNNF